MLVAVRFTINDKQYNGYIDNELLFTQKPLLEKAEALSLMNDINTSLVDEAEMTYDAVNDNFYDDYCCCDDHSGKDYATEDGIKHLYDFAEDYFENWIAEPRKITLYKDTNGNLWDYVGKDDESKLHEVTVVDEDDGYYTNTSITWYMTDEEFANCKQIEVEV